MASKDSTTQGPTSEPIPSVTEPAASTKSPKPSSSSQLRYLLWPVVCLFQFGLIVGGVVWGRGLVRTVPVGPKQEMAQGREPAPVRRVASKSGAPPQLAGEGLERGDQLILEGNYEAALAIYQPPEADAAPPFHSSLQYRIGVCQEALGRWDQAISAYRAVSSHGATPTIVAAGQVGQARIWIRMRKLVEAKKLLCDLTLRSGHPGLEEHPLLADARFLLALTASLENVHNEKPGAANDALAAYTLTDWPLERVLKWADVVQARGDTKGKVQQKPGISVHRLGPGLDKCTIIARTEQTSTSEFLESVAKQCGLEIQWSPAALQLLQARTVTVDVSRLPVPDLLLALTDPLGLAWTMAGNSLRVSSEQDMPRDALAANRRGKVSRMLRDAIVAHPGHSLTPAAYLELGNLEGSENRWSDAVTWYVRLVRELPRSPVLTEAYYNLGTAQRMLGNSAEARSWYYRVVDGAPGNELTPLAYLKIGRLYLDEGDPEHAISPLRRAAAAGAGTATQPVAALTLAAAYILTNHPRAANAVLADHRAPLGADAYRALAAFLDALARYREAGDRKHAQREGAELLGALLATENSNLLGPVESLLAAQAYGDLGMGEQKMQLYEKLAQSSKGGLGANAVHTLAEFLFAANEREAAKRLFTSLAATAKGDLASQARYRLAELALKDMRPAECLDLCRELLIDKSPVELAPFLEMIGTAFEQLGQHRQAALCFSGQLPSDFGTRPAQPPMKPGRVNKP